MPGQPTILYHVAATYRQLGETEEAIRRLRTALRDGTFAERIEAARMLEDLARGRLDQPGRQGD